MLSTFLPKNLIVARLSGLITRNIIAPNLPFLLPPPGGNKDGANPLLSFALKACETELEQGRAAYNTSDTTTSDKHSVGKKREIFFQQLKALLPPEKLQPYDTNLPLSTYLKSHSPPVLMSFLRKQYLTCTTLPFYTASNSSILKKALKLPPNPSLSQLSSTFSLSPKKVPKNPSISSLLKPLPAPKSSYLTSELTHAGSYVSFPWLGMLYLESLNIYELHYEEFIKDITVNIKKVYGRNVGLYEVGAGSGSLGCGIKNLNKPWLKVRCSDDNSWGLSSNPLVERLNVEQALEGLDHDVTNVVIVSWMPQGVDWTKYFRRKNVEGYILIGEYWDGCCGDNWETWGNPDFKTFKDDGEEIKPYEKDGYEAFKIEMDQVSRYCTVNDRRTGTWFFKKKKEG